jgi:hypothetical protein
MRGGTRSMHERERESETIDAYNILVSKFNRRDHLGDLDIDAK